MRSLAASRRAYRTHLGAHLPRPRHPVAALLVPVVAASVIGGFISGQFAGHLPQVAIAAQATTQQTAAQVQGSLGQRGGASVAHQPVTRMVYVPPAEIAAKSATALRPSPRAGPHQEPGESHGNRGNHQHDGRKGNHDPGAQHGQGRQHGQGAQHGHGAQHRH